MPTYIMDHDVVAEVTGQEVQFTTADARPLIRVKASPAVVRSVESLSELWRDVCAQRPELLEQIGAPWCRGDQLPQCVPLGCTCRWVYGDTPRCKLHGLRTVRTAWNAHPARLDARPSRK